MLIPPLKAPLEQDIKSSLSSWLDESNNQCGFLSLQVQPDLERLASLRDSLSRAGAAYRESEAVLGDYQEYHAALLECEARGFPSNETETSIRFLQFPWKAALTSQTEVQSHLKWERANLLWNVAALLSYQASLQDKGDMNGWNQAHVLLQAAASTMYHLREFGEASDDFTSLAFWQTFLLAQAQVATYYMALAAPRPRHAVLAKLASAAVPILNGAYDECPQSQESWQVHCKAWSTWMLALAQYHEACVHRQKNQGGMELVRLELAREAIACCQEFVYSEVDGLEMLQGEVPKMVRAIRDRLLEARRNYEGSLEDVAHAEVREIRGELLVKPNHPLGNEMTTLKKPLFRKVKKVAVETGSRQAILKFHREIDAMINELGRVAEEKVEEGRMTLAGVNLPHSLTAYKQEQIGGGIPMELWERIEALREEGLISQLKREMWELREVAESAMSVHNKVSKQLAEDMELDQQFRAHHPRFEGHPASEVQRSFRLSLKNYELLLAKSREGDTVLIRRLESLDTDPKYKLLQFQKSQLDRLLPAGEEGEPPIDSSRLARLLVALSSLFDEREDFLHKLRSEAKKYDIAWKMAGVDPKSPTAKEDYERVVQMSLKSFGGITYDIRTNITRQVELVESIMTENDRFVAARDAGPSSSANESCIVMIEDAIEEAEQLSKHLREGRDFYKIVIPRLEHLKQEVGGASVRLTIERCEYEESARRGHQESRDAHFAASLAGDANGSPSRPIQNDSKSGRATQDFSQQQQVGVQTVTTSNSAIAVDDSKVAHLVAMDFDPDKVVAALKNHNNDMDQALNELLC
jgi:programmed cell death 6-interacting protein